MSPTNTIYREPDTLQTFKRWAGLVLLLIVGLFTVALSGSMVENVDADEILVVQAPISGNLTWYISAGIKPQWWGKVTSYPKRAIYEFEAPVQFNDGGKGVIFGSIQYDMPLDVENLNELHTRFGSADAIQKQVMEVVTNKVIYMTGPVMSSRESYAEKRNYLINYIQDQIDLGVYQTRQAQAEAVDTFSGQKKIVNVAEIVVGADGRPMRQEQSVVGEFGIRAFNFAIEQIDYDDTVENQIKDQQKIAMDVQTSIADALKAQQAAITVEQQGRAQAAEAKWQQEVIKAKQVTEAESRLAVQILANQEAEQYRQATLKRAEADAGYRRQVMAADGALEQKLHAYVQVNAKYAEAIQNYKGNWVPGVMTGGGGSVNGATSLIDLLSVKAARDLSLELTPTAK